MEKRRAYGWAETWEIRLRSFTDFAWRQFALRFFRLYFCLHRNRSTGTVQWFSRERFATIYIMSVVINKARKWIINTIRDAIFVRHHLIIPPPIKFTHLSVYLLYNSSISFDHSFFSNIHILHIYIYTYDKKLSSLIDDEGMNDFEANLWKIFFIKASNSPYFSRSSTSPHR